ncbi:hypothetical protein MTBBW1_2040005 [Desulfamplus magnetovallimortis]|uniref:Uncharacterized protein n=1 Tax=Desulfamplus magnetovallimortis TaxID=1246637 RepID=A0A1W1HCA5_9BACT|nr:hypothetical protein MTBBW1_2040005 [Desulfamplus magnetovallimortis]
MLVLILVVFVFYGINKKNAVAFKKVFDIRSENLYIHQVFLRRNSSSQKKERAALEKIFCF